MAQKRKRPVAWGRRVVFYVLFPLVVWVFAFLLWFYWLDLRKLFSKEEVSKDRPKSSRQVDKRETEERPPPKNRSQEKILEEDRKKLEDIIERRG